MRRSANAGEGTDDVDLVGWVMTGVQHIPRSEDVPVVRLTLHRLHYCTIQLQCAAQHILIRSVTLPLLHVSRCFLCAVKLGYGR